MGKFVGQPIVLDNCFGGVDITFSSYNNNK
jgi:hypothetical protein